MAQTARWTVEVSKETDEAVRLHLSRQGRNTADLGAFIEDAVRWRVFDQTLSEAREAFADLAPEDLDSLLSEAVANARR